MKDFFTPDLSTTHRRMHTTIVHGGLLLGLFMDTMFVVKSGGLSLNVFKHLVEFNLACFIPYVIARNADQLSTTIAANRIARTIRDPWELSSFESGYNADSMYLWHSGHKFESAKMTVLREMSLAPFFFISPGASLLYALFTPETVINNLRVAKKVEQGNY